MSDEPNDDEQAAPSYGGAAIAIVGMAGRFPGASNTRELWANIRNGVESISRFKPEELEDAFDAETRNSPDFVAARSILEDVDQFEPEFFGMHAREAALTDPQHRILLECAWEALEDAGYDPAAYKGPIGVFAGAALNSYLIRHVCADRAAIEQITSNYQVGSYAEISGSLADFLATRIAYKLDLKGPAINVQSACSTSAVAVVQACQSLLLYQSDMALAGGVSITFPQKRGYQTMEGGIVSPDAHCRPFDADANGTVFGSGAGIVLLKRLDDALADGDHIYAVIRGFGINNDGAEKIGFTAPSVEGQAAAIAAAHAMAEIDAASVGYVECHGTATPLGDPIEFNGLVKAFRATTDERNFCTLGAVKANFGHLDAAAGVTGLIKAALVLKAAELPPLVNFTRPNPHIDLASSPFRIATERTPWAEGATPRRAGVSSFGMGGTNVHMVLEEAPRTETERQPTVRHLLPLSARTPESLERMVLGLAAHLEANPALDLADVAHTLQIGRRAFDVRTAVAAASIEEAVTQLKKAPKPRTKTAAPKIVFMFPGQGAQYPGMGKALYESEPLFREIVDLGARVLKQVMDVDLCAVLFADVPEGDDTPHPIRSTVLAQPALFVIEYATARVLMERGIEPAAMIGHSLGEFVAACLAGVFSFEDGLRLVAARGRLMQDQPPGAMLAVRLSEAELAPLCGTAVEIAAINAPALCVASGPFDAIEDLERRLTAQDITHRRLHTSHAFHSAMMDGAVEAFRAEAAKVKFEAPSRRYVSAVSGTWITAQEAGSPDYWARHCRETVRFAPALQTLLAEKDFVLVEVGPGRTLTTFAGQSPDKSPIRAAIATLPEFAARADEPATFARALAALWCEGAPLDWTKLGAEGARRISLPTYAFARKRYWVDAPAAATVERAAAPSVPIPQPTTPAALAFPSAVTIQEPPMTDSTTQVQVSIRALFEELSGESMADASPTTGFVELGFDSLFLGQVVQRLQKSFGVKITFRQLMKDYPTLETLAAHVAKNARPGTLPAAASAPVAAPPRPLPAAPQAVAAPPMLQMPAPNLASASGMEQLFQSQLAAMQNLIAQQLQTMQAVSSTPSAAPAMPATAPAAPPEPKTALTPLPVEDASAPSRFQMYRPGGATAADDITPEKRAFIESLVSRYVAKTPGSKARTQAGRSVLADPRSANGFRAEWKEMVYPLHVERSKGSKLWDVDGNEYIDLVNGFGQTMFGHAPDFVVEAVTKQLAEGFAIGPQTPLAIEVARLFAEMTGNERVTFCNTGSEAVMAAMRVARTVTGRDKIVVFGGSYHGQFDEVLVKPSAGKSNRTAMPVTPGIPQESVDNVVVLPYGTPESLAWVRANAHELAAVMAETVQSRHPHLRPREFLAELRSITEESGSALIFDEVVTGFRVHPGGMQAIFGIRADMATYGKVVGGGMPVGVLAGKKEFMDALDGGHWQYGDDSVPEVAPTFFAGTFVRHPLVMAACRAVLHHMKERGTALQDELGERMRRLVAELNGELERHGAKTRFESFSSWCVVNFAAEDPLGTLLFAHMRLLGVHVLDGFPWFLTTQHTDADTARIARAFRESLEALRKVGILGSGSASKSAASASATATTAPLTEAQAEIWLAAQLSDEASCAYNESGTLTLEGELNAPQFVAALNDVVARHDALRTTVSAIGDSLHVAPKLELHVPLIDVSADPGGDAKLKALIDEEARTPFDLTNGPLARGKLVKLAPGKHSLIFTAHHIVCDGWSMAIIMSELSACYAARLTGETAELDEPLPFHRYASERGAAEPDPKVAKFWRDEYADLPPPLELPADRQRPPVKTFRGATFTDQLDADLIAAVKRAGARHGATLFATLFAAAQVVLGKLSGERDVALVVPMAGQTLLEDQILVGHAVDFLPLRAPFDDDQSFGAHLAAVKAKIMAAMEHQGYTYGTLLKQLDIKRTPNRTPITDVQFNLEKIGAGLEFPNLKATLRSSPKAFVNFDLFFNMTEEQKGIRVDVDYSTDLYDASTIRRWVSYLRNLLRTIAEDAARPIRELVLMDERERRWLIADLNATARRYPKDALVHELIEEQAARTPDAVALECGKATLTYRELNERASGMAARLAKVLPEGGKRIAVAVPRSFDLIASLLAVMKSGNAYVPLDATHPPARLSQTLEAADVGALICASDDIEALAPAGARVVRLDQPVAAVELSNIPRPREGASAPAYVIFTSGSTGTPKGVEIEHRAVVNFLLSMAKEPGFAAKDTIVAVTTVSFDIAALEMYLPLVTGGRAVIASREQVQGGFTLAEMINASGATVVQATPSLWRMLLEAGVKTGPHLKMLCGGEPLPRDLANKLASTGGELWNVYGPTETTIWSSAGRVEAGSDPITIGAPIANTEIHILDRHDKLAPVGAVGDVYIGGDGLARGYFNRPDLTSSAFRTIDLGDGVARRLYRTGDVGRRLANGAIQLQGRKDHQVKLRGYRIELEDIESNLRRLPGIADAAAAVQGAGEADARLVGYYVAADGRDMQPALLQRQLGEKLPDYMVPTVWQRLDRMPQTANGKLDRKALPQVRTAPQLKVVAQTARTLTAAEESVAKLWRELLETNEITPDTHFFESGGHSLLAMRLIARLRTEMKRPVTIADLFRKPRLADFAKAVAGAGEPGGEADKIVHIQGGARPPVIFINNAWNLFPLAKALGPDQPVISIQFVDRTIEEPKSQVTWDEVVDEAVSLIRKAKPNGDYILAGHCVLGAVAFEAARRLKAEGEAVRLVALMDTEQNLKLAGLPAAARFYNWWALQIRNMRWFAALWANGRVNVPHILARYPLAHRLGIVHLQRMLGAKEKWNPEDFHTQHVVDAWMRRTSTPYNGDVVYYRAQPEERPGFLDRWLPLKGWHALVGARLTERAIRAPHAEVFREEAAAEIGADLRRHIDRALAPPGSKPAETSTIEAA